MKIQPNEGAPKTATPARDAKPVKSFGDLMREKTRPKATLPEEPMGGGPPMTPLPTLREPSPVPVETSAVREVPPVIQALCTEIVERVEQIGPSEVRIEFRSTVLDGLAVTAIRDGASLEVQFHTATPATAALLAGNSSVLAERLERIGYTARISVRRVAKPEPREEERQR